MEEVVSDKRLSLVGRRPGHNWHGLDAPARKNQPRLLEETHPFMPVPQRQRMSTSTAGLEWLITDDGSRTLFDTQLNETFHSGCGAVAETLIVYLQNSGVVKRLSQREPTAVLEYGLGTATAFLLTAALAEWHQAKLTYHALERSLLPMEIFCALDLPQTVESCLTGDHARTAGQPSPFRLEQFAAIPQLSTALFAQLAVLAESPVAGTHCLRLTDCVELTLILGDARDYPTTGQPAADETASHGFNAIYFDAFSPESNPDLWTLEVFQRAAHLLLPAGSLTSYCVKSSVHRMLDAAGLHVAKMPGPIAGKREVLVATKKPISQD